MKNHIEERSVLLRIATSDFDEASRSLTLCKRIKTPDTIAALIRDSIIAYARPFSANHGRFQKTNLQLTQKHVPKEFRDIHKSVIEVRDRVIAHIDLNFRNPTLAKWQLRSGFAYPISFRGFYHEHLFPYRTSLPPLIQGVKINVLEEIEAIKAKYL